MINCEKIMGDYEKCCKARISALMSRVCHMEMMLEKVLGQMDVEAKQQQLYFPCADSSCVPHLQRKTVFLEQPGSTPSLHEAARLQNTVALARSLSRGADPNALDVRGDTALHCAARSGDALAAELLLACGATLDVCGVGGASPLSVAIREGHTNVVQVLLEKGANIEHQDDIGLSPLITALFSENLEMVNLLAKKAAILGVVESPLITASRFCRTDNLKVLIDILQPSKEQILEAISVAFSPNVAVILLEKTSKEIICSTNFSLLPQFAKKDWVQPIATNLKICTDCNNEEIIGNLQQAIAVSISEQILVILWRHRRKSTLAIAMERCALMKWTVSLKDILLHWKRCYDLHIVKNDKELPVAMSERIVLLLLKLFPKLMYATIGREVFLWSAEQGWWSVLKTFLENNFSVDAVRSDGFSALHCAAARGHGGCMKLLIMNGASVNLTDENGSTPLHIAVESGHKCAVKVLLSAGANPKVKDHYGLMPSNIAFSVDIVRLLHTYVQKSDT